MIESENVVVDEKTSKMSLVNNHKTNDRKGKDKEVSKV